MIPGQALASLGRTLEVPLNAIASRAPASPQPALRTPYTRANIRSEGAACQMGARLASAPGTRTAKVAFGSSRLLAALRCGGEASWLGGRCHACHPGRVLGRTRERPRQPECLLGALVVPAPVRDHCLGGCQRDRHAVAYPGHITSRVPLTGAPPVEPDRPGFDRIDR